MKNTSMLAVAIGLLFSAGAFAQNIENVTKETTVKKVTVKDTDVKTEVQTDVKKEVSTLSVEGSDSVNQATETIVLEDAKTRSVEVIKEGANLENQARLEKQKKEQYERVDGQQRGIPIKTDEDVQVKPLKKEKPAVQEKKKKSDG